MTSTGILSSSALGIGVNIASTFVGTNTLFKSSNDRRFQSSNISIIAPSNISENAADDYVVTDHPSESGVLISDHMYALPKTIDIRIAYSLASGFNALKTVASLAGYGTKPESLIDRYQKFLQLQSDRIPFDITTGKRQYKNMVITSIKNLTDVGTENILILDIRCREVIIKSVKTTSVDNQKDAPNTAESTSVGKSSSTPSTSTPPPGVSPTTAGL